MHTLSRYLSGAVLGKFAHSGNKGKLSEGHVNDNDVHSSDKMCSSAHNYGWSIAVLLGERIEYYYYYYYYY